MNSPISFFYSDAVLDEWLREDIGYVDLTSHVLKLNQQTASVQWHTRSPLTISGSEEVVRLAEKLGAHINHFTPSGVHLDANQTIVEASGPAHALLNAWKVGQNLLEYACAIATRSAELLAHIRAVHPTITLLSTRKHPPGLRAVAQKAAMAGGIFPHRLGLSETVLVFPQHRSLLGNNWDTLAELLDQQRHMLIEKKIVIEAQNLDEAQHCLNLGADVIQFDKVEPETLHNYVRTLRQHNPAVTLLAAGGITLQNATAYAATGVDGLVSSSMYFGPPADIGVQFSLTNDATLGL